MLKSAI